LSYRHPKITLQITRKIALRSLHLLSNKQRVVPNNKLLPELYGRNNVNLKTIGIIPVNGTVPIIEFAEYLRYELMHSVDATCTLLNSATVTSNMGKHAFSQLGKLRLASWLAEQEEKYRIVLYLADSGSHSWMRTCIRQADCILLVGLGNNDPSVDEYEHFLINMKTTARKELVLLHPERSCPAGATQNWLKVVRKEIIDIKKKKNSKYIYKRIVYGFKPIITSICPCETIMPNHGLPKVYFIMSRIRSRSIMDKKGKPSHLITTLQGWREDYAENRWHWC
jgi:hypothetical protein